MSYCPGFLRFWAAYPRKVGKGAAYRAWQKGVPPMFHVEHILESLEKHKNCKQWHQGFIPNPSTWLNQRRWEDEPEPMKATRCRIVGCLEAAQAGQDRCHAHDRANFHRPATRPKRSR